MIRLDRSKSRLFVEGEHDGGVINTLVRLHLKIDLSVKQQRVVEVCHSDSQVADAVDTALKQKVMKTIGIVVDNDAAWPLIQEVLRKHGIDPALHPDGSIVTTADERVGWWVMPDNQRSGALEDLVMTLVPKESPDWRFAEKTAIEAKQHGATYTDNQAKKAHLHTWLAWQDYPGAPYGKAIDAKMLSPSSPNADAFVAWFKRLFIDEDVIA